jgi:head-tail adaptor
MSGEFAGALRERIIIEKRSATRDAGARAHGGYGYDGAAWASVMPLILGDLTQADSLSALPRWRVIMRKREDIGPWSRLVWRRKYLMVRGVVSDPAEPSQMVITADEVR